MNNDVKRQQAIAKVENHHALLSVYKKEKKHVDAIIDQALNFPSGGNRWRAYEALKKQADLLTGWNATQSEFADSMYYNAMVDFVDYLLPEVQDEEETQEQALDYPELYPELSIYVPVEEIEAWHEHAVLVLQQIKDEQLQVTGAKNENRLLLEEMYSKMFKSGDGKDDAIGY